MESIEDILNEIKNCKKCELYKIKTNYVPGTGNPSAKIVFVGEAPGRDEDLQGEPFVGAAGKLLNEMLSKIGLSRKDVYICNVVKCRPPNNREPSEEEISACGDYLKRQLNAIKPNLIVCLGRVAARFVFEDFGLEFTSISKVKGKVFEVERWGKKVKIYPIYHPAAILYRQQLREDYEKMFKNIILLAGLKRQPDLFDFIN